MSKTRIVCGILFAVSLQLPGATLDVKTFGAKADGKSSDREAISKATFVLKNVENFETHHCRPAPDMQIAKVDRREFYSRPRDMGYGHG